MNEHYAAVIRDLSDRKVKLENELHGIEAAIQGLIRVFGESPVTWALSTEASPDMVVSERGVVQAKSAQADASSPMPEDDRYSNISLRWAVMWRLADSGDWEKTGDVAKAVAAGGYKPKNETKSGISNLVSAVLSNMRGSGEVETNETGGYRLTADGRLKWGLIRQSGKFRSAISGAPNEQSLLAVQ